MAFTEVLDLDCDTTTALGGFNRKTKKDNPTKVEGYYIGSKNTPSPKAKSGFAKLHIFQTSNGRVGVWGKTDLDRKMLSATVGAMTRVTQSGVTPTQNGDMYKFRVEVDSENTIEVNLPSGEGETQSDEEYVAESEGLDSEETASDEVTYSRPAAPVAPATSPTAAQRNKVQDLLKSRRSA